MNLPLATMFHYNRWANETILDAYAALSPEQRGASVAGTFGSISETLRHLLGGQDMFLFRLSGVDESLVPNLMRWGGDPSLAEMREWTAASSDALIAVAEALVEEEPVRLPRYEGADTETDKGFLLLHALYHGIEHRGQICTTLTQIGVTPPDLDGWGYAEANGLVRPL